MFSKDFPLYIRVRSNPSYDGSFLSKSGYDKEIHFENGYYSGLSDSYDFIGWTGKNTSQDGLSKAFSALVLIQPCRFP